MVNKDTIRLLSLGMLAAVSVTYCAGQVTPKPAGGGNGPAILPTPAGPDVISEKPPNPPNVTCQGDQLTVLADNSTLGSVLTAIHACTGVLIDIPEGASNTRTFDHLGPGPAREILTSLLSGTEFNYVIESSESDPQKVEGVLLLASGDGAPAAAVQEGFVNTPGRRAWKLTQRTGRPVYTGHEDGSPAVAGVQNSVPVEDIPPDAIDNPSASADTTPAASDAAPAADSNAAPTQDPGGTSADAGAGALQPSTMENKINSMQQLFEQRRQMQGNQSAPVQPQ